MCTHIPAIVYNVCVSLFWFDVNAIYVKSMAFSFQGNQTGKQKVLKPTGGWQHAGIL
jgi:hypothetical protein